MVDKFNFGVELDVDQESFEKATKGSKADKYKNMIVFGKASDSSTDQDGQNLYPSGFDFSYFLTNGLINLDHLTTRKGDSKFWVGEPVDAYVKGEEFFVKAQLWEKSEVARNFYDTVIAMKESGSKRKPGFSVEGKAIEKDAFNKNKILKAKIINCAVTLQPVNTQSWFDIVKGQTTEPVIEEQIKLPFDITPYLMQYETEDGSIVTINRDLSIKIDRAGIKKTMDVAAIKPLMPESLDKRLKNMEQAKTILKSINLNQVERDFGKEIIKKIFYS